MSGLRAIRRGRTYWILVLGSAFCATSAWSADALPEPTPLEELESDALCNRCAGTLLPGEVVPHPDTRWGIISDLPETFKGSGVLYSTRPVLPPNGAPPEMLRQRRAQGFESIDAGFDVFLFHINKSTTGSQRLVVYAKNLGQEPVTLRPEQVIKTEGVIGTVHEFESTLGARVLKGEWDRPFEKVTIAPGEGRVVAFSKNFGSGVADGPDASRNVNAFGYARVELEEGKSTPSLEVSVISIPAGERSKMDEEAERYGEAGPRSTDIVRLDREPQGCALGRAVGVYSNFRWISRNVVIDASKLEESGTAFPMALPEIQTRGCPEARQTQDLVLYPGYTRPDTIGNYMIEYGVTFTLTNPSDRTQAADVVFGKDDADIGLAYATAVTPAGEAAPPRSTDTVKALWAGPKQSAREKSLLGQPVVLSPGEAKTVHLRFLILGNSSLPFRLGIKPAPAVAVQK